VVLPDEYVELQIDGLAAKIRKNHEATLLAIGRGDALFLNPRSDFELRRGDHAVVVSRSMKALSPLTIADMVHQVSS
jgi:Trk K+ transport system NAD-binding subunit